MIIGRTRPKKKNPKETKGLLKTGMFVVVHGQVSHSNGNAWLRMALRHPTERHWTTLHIQPKSRIVGDQGLVKKGCSRFFFMVRCLIQLLMIGCVWPLDIQRNATEQHFTDNQNQEYEETKLLVNERKGSFRAHGQVSHSNDNAWLYGPLTSTGTPLDNTSQTTKTTERRNRARKGQKKASRVIHGRVKNHGLEEQVKKMPKKDVPGYSWAGASVIY